MFVNSLVVPLCWHYKISLLDPHYKVKYCSYIIIKSHLAAPHFWHCFSRYALCLIFCFNIFIWLWKFNDSFRIIPKYLYSFTLSKFSSFIFIFSMYHVPCKRLFPTLLWLEDGVVHMGRISFHYGYSVWSLTSFVTPCIQFLICWSNYVGFILKISPCLRHCDVKRPIYLFFLKMEKPTGSVSI